MASPGDGPAPVTGAPGRRPLLTPVRAAACAALLAVAVDLNALPGSFLADDFAIVLENPHVVRPDPAAIFATDYWGGGGDSGLYRPLTVLTYALNRLAFGADPWSYHLVNALLHAGTTFLFASTLSALGFLPPLVLAAAGLFAAHPVHADLVNIVVGRAELLAACFLFAALRLALAGRRRWWPAVLALYVAALLSKEHAVTFLPLLVAAGAFAGPGFGAAWRRDRWLYALSAAVTVGWLLLRSRVLQSSGAAPLLVYAADNPLHGAALPARIAGAAKVNLCYLANLLLPLRLQSVYSGPALRELVAFSPWRDLAGAAWVLASGAAAVHGWVRRKPWGFGLLLWFAGFGVTANLFVTITVLLADRFAYLPAAGLCLSAAGLLLLPSARARDPRAARALLLLPAACALLLGWLTVERNAAFRDPEVFWRSVTAVDPGNVRAWYFLAQAAQAAGRPGDVEEALRGALRADPSLPDAHIAYSLLMLDLGRPVEAAAAARQALELAPGAVGLAQLALARAELALGRPVETMGLLDEAGPMLGATFEWWQTRGAALEALDAPEKAAHAYRQALALRDDEGARRGLERALHRLGRAAP